MGRKVGIVGAAVAAIALATGVWIGAQQKFGTPSTIIHISIIKWKADAPEAERQKALNGVKEMAAKIPGMKNVWIKAIRVQPQGYHAAFVVEFENQAAADRYAKDPIHDEWTKHFQSVREETISPQVTN